MEMLTRTEVARRLGVKDYQLAYLYANQLLPEPGRVGGRRVYGPADLETVRQYVEAHGVRGRGRGKPRQEFTT
jgi:DNA-binding transcriptional MerR regulator